MLSCSMLHVYAGRQWRRVKRTLRGNDIDAFATNHAPRL
jgi:hypothetical protein